MQERTEGEGLVHKEAREEEATDSKQREPVTFLFRGKPDSWVLKSNCVPNGSKEQDGQADEEGKASQRFRGFHLGPNEFKSEASPVGIADLLLNPHAAIIEGSQVGERIITVRGQPPGFALAFRPYAHHPDGDGSIRTKKNGSEI